MYHCDTTNSLAEYLFMQFRMAPELISEALKSQSQQ